MESVPNESLECVLTLNDNHKLLGFMSCVCVRPYQRKVSLQACPRVHLTESYRPWIMFVENKSLKVHNYVSNGPKSFTPHSLALMLFGWRKTTHTHTQVMPTLNGGMKAS